MLLKKNILRTYINSLPPKHKQRSPEWKAARMNSIGGSEIDKVLKNPKEIIKAKCEIGRPFNGSPATRWGNVFESATSLFTEYVFNMEESDDLDITEIYEIDGVDGPIQYQTYSPDGVGVVNINGVSHIVLFEFKSPYSRVSTTNTIPNEYMPQVKTGMISIPPVEFSIFVSNCYRICSEEQVAWNSDYDKTYHSKPPFFNNMPLAIGYLLFWSNEDINIYNDDYAIKLVVDGKLKCSTVMCFNNDEINKLPIVIKYDLIKSCANLENPINVLQEQGDVHIQNMALMDYKLCYQIAWKLFQSNIVQCDRDNNWINVIAEPIKQVMAEIHKIRGNTNVIESYNTYIGAKDDSIICNTDNDELLNML